MKVTVFGGAMPKPGEPAYEEALTLGRLLGQAGHTVLTGGYMGIMEAVSRGAAEAGGHVIGVTCDEIERYRNSKANAWVKEEWRYAALDDRMIALMDNADAVIALPGGPGTLAEISLLWNRLLVHAIPPRPLILIGPGWKSTFRQLYITLGEYYTLENRNLITFAPSPEAAVVLVPPPARQTAP